MEKNNFWEKFGKFSGLLFVILTWVMILSYKSPEPPQSTNKITTMGSYSVYRLNVDREEYIVIGNSSCVSIIKHR
jgi:hypothetical protein